jgi:hypothetical protein
MLNLYIAARGTRTPVPTEEAIDATLAELRRLGVVGVFADGAWSPGPGAARLFRENTHDDYLPAELTFDALSVHTMPRPRFLPRDQGHGFPQARCRMCGDLLDEDALDESLRRVEFFPVDRFELRCPACRSDLGLRDIDFGQATGVARFWIFVEGAATSRLNGALVDQLSRLLGVGLSVVPEVPLDDVEDWVPALRGRR